MNDRIPWKQILGLAALLIFTQTTSAEMMARMQRFAQRDPARYVDGPSLYRYCRAEPLATTDPRGLEPYTCGDSCSTCSSCQSGCATENGYTECNGGRPCCCVCRDEIERRQSGWDKRVREAEKTCVERHELRHVLDYYANKTCRWPGHNPPPDTGCSAWNTTVGCLVSDGDVNSCAADAACRADLIGYINAKESLCNAECNPGQCSIWFWELRTILGLQEP